MMILESLENLVKIHKLKKEPADQNEFNGMLSSATRRLKDAQVVDLSEDSQFSLAYAKEGSCRLFYNLKNTEKYGHPLNC